MSARRRSSGTMSTIGRLPTLRRVRKGEPLDWSVRVNQARGEYLFFFETNAYNAHKIFDSVVRRLERFGRRGYLQHATEVELTHRNKLVKWYAP